MNATGTKSDPETSLSISATNKRQLPNLMIAGAQKSGTSTLYSWLAEHPRCLMSNPKEPMYFSQQQKYDADEYSEYFTAQPHHNECRIIGEASTTYLSVPEVAGRIAAALGTNIKFIFVLRDPVQRAVSAYWHMAKRFHELRSLKSVLSVSDTRPGTALKTEESRIRMAEQSGAIVTDGYQESLGDRYWSFRYLRNSLYLDDLKQFESCFGRSNMLVLLTDDLATDPVGTFHRVADFVGIDSNFLPSSVGMTHNATRVLPQTRLTRMLYRRLSRVPGVGRSIRSRVMNAVSKPTPPIPAEVTDTLAHLFASHNHELSRYLNRNLSHWSKSVAQTETVESGARDAA